VTLLQRIRYTDWNRHREVHVMDLYSEAIQLADELNVIRDVCGVEACDFVKRSLRASDPEAWRDTVVAALQQYEQDRVAGYDRYVA